MRIAWGVLVTGLALLCWGGQLVSWLAPERAVKWGLMESQTDVEPTYWADIRAEARWDVLTLWTMVVSGVLLLADHGDWAFFGLVGGGMYLYFAGRGIWARAVMRRAGLRIGSPRSVGVGVLFLSLWGVMAAVTIVAAVRELRS